MKLFSLSFLSFSTPLGQSRPQPTNNQDKDEAPLRYRARSMLRRAGSGKQS
jgi:hypothetical protein